jgi:signal transduction histidine kinase
MTEAGERTAEARLEALQALHGLLGAVAREIGPALELQPVLETVLNAMRSLVDFRGGSIGLLDAESVYIAVSDPPVTDDVRALRIPVGTGLAGRVITSGETVYSPDVHTDPRVDPAVRVTGTNAAMRSFLAVPLVCLGQVIGVLQVDSTVPNAFDDDDRLVLEGLAVQVAGAIESARRHEEMLELEQRKSDFTARVSHELRTPLTIIAGLLQTLQSHDSNLTDDQRYWLERVHAATRRLNGLVEDLVALSRFEDGVGAPQSELIDFRPIGDSHPTSPSS